MKTKLLLFMIALLLFTACTSSKRKEDINPENSTNQGESTTEKLHIYYFYGSHRCATCSAVETNLKQLITDHFTEKVDEGTLLVSYINWEDQTNKKLIEKYQIYSSALLFIKKTDGKEEVIDLTEYAFANARKQPELYRKTLQDSIQNIIY